MKHTSKSDLDVIIIYRNFRHYHGVSHIGLGVSALNISKTLNHAGIRCRVFPIAEAKDIKGVLEKNTATHVVIQAIWVPPSILGDLAGTFPDTQFSCTCHSNVGFLSAEPGAITMFKEYLNLERETVNFHAAGNSYRFCKSIEESFTEPCTYLPNMYWTHHKHGEPKRGWNDIGGTLRIGIFGAPRIQKNMLSGVMASIEIASNLGAFTEIYISSGREDGGKERANAIRQGCKNLVANLPNIKLIEVNWASWTQFLKIVGSMNLLMQMSYTESFNIVTADGCAEGVPSVVSSAITWAPRSWVADVDDATDIARVGCQVLSDPMSATHGFHALKKHNKSSLHAWLEYLMDDKFGDN